MLLPLVITGVSKGQHDIKPLKNANSFWRMLSAVIAQVIRAQLLALTFPTK
jgi:hypothetical protein